MKKLFFCIAILIAELAFPLYCPNSQADWESYYESESEYEDTDDSVDCAAACSGRNPSADACNKCNNCEGWGSDESVARCRNPF